MIKSLFFVIFLWLNFYSFSQNKKKPLNTNTHKDSCCLRIHLIHPNNSKIMTVSTCGVSFEDMIKHIVTQFKDYEMTIYEASCLGKKIDLFTDSAIKKFNDEYSASSKNKSESDEAKELKKLSSNQFFSGVIYFSGQGFSTILSIKANDKIFLEKTIARCLPGSIITFDNCQFKDGISGKTLTVNKSLKLY